MAEVATSVNGSDRHRMSSVETKYPVEPPGSGTSSWEAINLPIPKEKCETATENVGDCRPLLSVL